MSCSVKLSSTHISTKTPACRLASTGMPGFSTLNMIKGGILMTIEVVPEWMVNLDDEDILFIKKFLKSSGSLKEVARQYGVSYPTVRLRLDRLIQKIQLSEDTANEPYIGLIKRLMINEKLDFDTAKVLIHEYKKTKETE